MVKIVAGHPGDHQRSLDKQRWCPWATQNSHPLQQPPSPVCATNTVCLLCPLLREVTRRSDPIILNCTTFWKKVLKKLNIPLCRRHAPFGEEQQWLSIGSARWDDHDINTFWPNQWSLQNGEGCVTMTSVYPFWIPLNSYVFDTDTFLHLKLKCLGQTKESK